MGDIQTHLFYLCWWMCTHKQSEEHTHTFAGRHFQPLTHSVLGPWLPSKWFVSRDPSYSAGLNKSHQAASDSSYVDVMLNVIWRLGEHRIGPCSASQGTLSLCDVIFSFVDSVHSLMLSLSLCLSHTLTPTTNNQNPQCDTHCLIYYRSLQSWGHQFNPPHTPRRLFVLFFMFHFPSTHPWSLLSLQSLSCICSWRVASTSWLWRTLTHEWENSNNNLIYMLMHTTTHW